MAFQVLVLAALISLSVAQLEVPGTPVNTSDVQQPPPSIPPCDANSFYSMCSSCNSIAVCLAAQIDERNCASLTPDTPFCVNGMCSATPNNAAGCFQLSTICTGDGFYPDPKNCQIYHHCRAANQRSTVYECPPNYVFNIPNNNCRQKLHDTDCVRVQCDRTKIFSRYGSNSQFYAYCQYSGDVVENIAMLKCPPNNKFDGNGCEFKCPGKGNFQHSDVDKYYQCHYAGSELIYQVKTCSPGSLFLPWPFAICVHL